jgi:hypothetical protein
VEFARDRFLEEFRERLAKFDLELHAEETRLIEFGRFAAQDRKRRGEEKPDTFTFLGFTHYCGTTRKSGVFTVWRKTAKQRMVAKLRAIKAIGCTSRSRPSVNGCRRSSSVTTDTMPFRGTRIGFVSLANVCVDSGDLL